METFYWFPFLLFSRQENETVISYVSSFYERILHQTPEFFHRLFFYDEERLRALCRCWDREEMIFCSQCSHGLSPHKVPISSIFSQLFFHVTFSCWLRTFVSRSVSWVLFSTGSSYTSSGGYATVVNGWLSNVSNWIPSLAKKPTSIVVSICPTKGVVW